MPKAPDPDVIVIGAGPAGLMAAIEAGRRGRRVLLLDAGAAPARKLAAGAGAVTNRYATLRDGLFQYIRGIEHFPRAALMGFLPEHVTALLEAHALGWEEGAFGQVLADGGALAAALAADAAGAGVTLKLGAAVQAVERADGGFAVHMTRRRKLAAPAVVLASGGLAAPALGGTDLGYRTAAKAGLGVTGLDPALTRFLFAPADARRFQPAIGTEVMARVSCGQRWFDSLLRFDGTGPHGAGLRQISTFWHPGEDLVLDLAPGWDAVAALETARAATPALPVAIALTLGLQRAVAETVARLAGVSGPAGTLDRAGIAAVSDAIHAVRLSPTGTLGFEDAETTLGGVALDAIDPMSMQATGVPGLYIVGELLDVTGWLGGYNLHWAWASGWAAGQAC